MARTMQFIVKLPVMGSSRLMGGAGGLGRSIDSVNIMDSPDIANWVRPNQLLLTTAYHYKDNPEDMVSLVQRLHQSNCAGLAIKMKRYILAIPDIVVQEADRLRFPLIGLPPTMLLGDVLNEILEHLLNEKQVELQKSFDLHRKFTQLFLQGADLSDIAQTLVAIIKKPILILNEHGDPAGISDAIRKRLGDPEFMLSIKKMLYAADLSVDKLSTLALGNDEVIRIYPVSVAGVLKGYLCMLDKESSGDVSLMPLEQAAHIIAYEHMRQEALVLGERRLRQQFVADMLDNKLSKEEIWLRGKKYEMPQEGGYLVCVCKSDPLPEGRLPSKLEQSSEREKRRGEIEKYWEAKAIQAITELKGDDVVSLLMLPAQPFSAVQEKEWVALLAELQAQLAKGTGARSESCSFGVSNYTGQSDKIAAAYREAEQALASGYAMRSRRFILTYRTQQVQELIQSVPGTKLNDFYLSSLGELVTVKSGEHEDLLRTMDIYLNYNCSVADTAKLLYIHRNTVLNRISRCEALLNVSMKDVHDTLKLRIALLIHQSRISEKE
ncbi:PucR family transcriptional regulator [Paenibacillus sp. 2TAB19]|uniref:PucR family transcriptional regulator n=1 Tax=Paenibacillus sp. 2TAB19 TaxID=3233003 RepID=UPI003F9CEB24